MGTMVEGGVLQVETIAHPKRQQNEDYPHGSSRFSVCNIADTDTKHGTEARICLKNTKIPAKCIRISNKKRTFAPLFPMMGRQENYITLLFNFLILM